MRTNRFLSIVFVFVSSIFADTIYLRDGQEVKDAVVTEVGHSDVKYKIGQREVVYTTKKSDIMMILYNDGGKDVFNAEAGKPGKPVATTKVIGNKKGGIRFGVKGGVALVGISGSDNYVNIASSSSGFGVGLGGFVSIPISSFYFVPELFVHYRKLGEFVNIYDRTWYYWVFGDRRIDHTGTYTDTFIYEEIGIDIPLTFRFFLDEGRKLYLEAGPQIGFVIGKSRILEYGLVLGAGYKITDNWGIDLRGYYSFANVYVHDIFKQCYFDDVDCIDQTTYIVDGHIYYGQIGVSYTF